MATGAGALHLGMIHGAGGYRGPGRIDVTGLAHVAGSNVGWPLTCCVSAIMAGTARLRCGAVVKHRHQPIGRDMTAITGKCGGNMRGTLAGRDHAVMAAVAAADHLGMIDQWIHRRPGGGVMAGIANIGGIDVRGGLACRTHPVMTLDAGAGANGTVIKTGDQPVDGAVATIALIGGGNMG